MKRKIRENENDGRQEIHAESEMTIVQRKGEKGGNQGIEVRETVLYRAGSGLRKVGGSVFRI